MLTIRRWRGMTGLLAAGGLSLTLGCQTWEGGMTLPSPRYLQDRPDYISQAPHFPLGRELTSMQAAAANLGVNGAPGMPGMNGAAGVAPAAAAPAAPVPPPVAVPPPGP
jgi:hypothetical protein